MRAGENAGSVFDEPVRLDAQEQERCEVPGDHVRGMFERLRMADLNDIPKLRSLRSVSFATRQFAASPGQPMRTSG